MKEHKRSALRRVSYLVSFLVVGLFSLSSAGISYGQLSTEGFEGVTFPPTAWEAINHSTTIGTNPQCWNRFTTTPWAPQFGLGHAGANFNCTTGANTISGWLLSPNRVFSNGDTLKFWTRKGSPDTFPDRLEVRLSTNGVSNNVGTTATDVGDFTTLLISVNPTLVTGVYPTTYTQFSVTLAGLPAGPNSGRIAFRYFVTSGGPSGANSDIISIDTVEFTTPTAADGTVSGSITDQNGVPMAGAVVNLSGTQNRKFITDANGNYRFENVETGGFYSVTPSMANYQFSPGSRSFSQIGNETEATFTATRDAGGGVNRIDTPEYFVRQHYLDFLGREPDESGFNFWSDQILSCGGDVSCRERRLVNVSAAYFLSIENQQTGGLVDGLYRASYGRRPSYNEFMPDRATVARDVVVGRADWAQQLEANKQALIADWVNRADFRAAHDGLGNDAYVDSLISHSAGFNGDRSALVNGLNGGSLTRGAALRQIVENEGFTSAKHNEMFVMMEYFGYLQRDPDASGYQFWLNKLNQFGGNFEQAEMVKAFIVSGEYRDRFRQ